VASDLEALERLYGFVHATAGAEIELYQRSADTIRVFRSSRGRIEVTTGTECGVAVRARSRSGGGIGFAAGSSASRQALDEALAEAVARCETGPAGDPWPPSTDRLQLDHDDGDLPGNEEVVAWLSRAWDRLAAHAAGDERVIPVAAWIDVASTVESWAAEALQASRRRIRASARVELVRSGGRGEGALDPIVVARRSWRDLADDAWTAVLADRWLAPAGGVAPAAREVTVLCNPECAAALVLAAVRARRPATDGERDGAAVGPGWHVVDDPPAPGALFGGEFDDVGFRTRRRVLADGRLWTGAAESKGHYRRTSFRDPPAPLPSSLVVLAPAQAPPPSCLLVTGLTIHAIGPGWVLEVDSAELTGGHPGAALPRTMLRTSPQEIAKRCVGSVGPARPSHLGVVAPALLFEGIRTGLQ